MKRRHITLQEVIEENMKDPEFRKGFERERLINAICVMIFKIRKASGLTQAELAKKANTTQPVIARLENGTSEARLPSLELLSRIASAAGATLNLDLKYQSD